jgi:hypothetical protein
MTEELAPLPGVNIDIVFVRAGIEDPADLVATYTCTLPLPDVSFMLEGMLSSVVVVPSIYTLLLYNVNAVDAVDITKYLFGALTVPLSIT